MLTAKAKATAAAAANPPRIPPSNLSPSLELWASGLGKEWLAIEVDIFRSATIWRSHLALNFLTLINLNRRDRP